MKKLIAILISLCLMLAAAGAFAETATTEMSWETVEPLLETYGLEGDFETFDEVAVQIWIPSSMTRLELTQEDVDKGFIAHFLDEDQTAQVSVVYVDVDGTTLEAFLPHTRLTPTQKISTLPTKDRLAKAPSVMTGRRRPARAVMLP